MKVAVVIPCFRVKEHILEVIAKIGSEVALIIIVDDACPENTGDFVKSKCKDPRIQIIKHTKNLGVGGAMVTGYKFALENNVSVVVKIDGDGQMDPQILQRFLEPILAGNADYTKGNRFFKPEFLSQMPGVRLFGNAVLSFINKWISGYWNIMDPTNGYTAIHSTALRYLPLDKLDKGYFFESDMLVRLNIIRAVVEDIPMEAYYGRERSHLSITKVVFEFPIKYISRFFKRIGYRYFLRDFNLGSVSFLFGMILFSFGSIFGIYKWFRSSWLEIEATPGEVMIASLPIILGFQLLLFGLQYDVISIPTKSIQSQLDNSQKN